MSSDNPTDHRLLLYPAIIGAGLLFVIGVRFLVVPDSAAMTFGIGDAPKGTELHHAIGLRDLWLALLAGIAALYRDWRSLALWFGLGSLVCFADATVVAGSNGPMWAVAFHTICGIACVLLTLLYRAKALGTV